MRKLLLFVSLFVTLQSQAQIFRLTYNTTICPSPLNGASVIYLYAGANISAPGNPPTHFADANLANLYPLTQTSAGIWEICFNPYQIFKDGNNSLIPGSATIFSFDINFRDALGNIFTGQCNNGAILISNPMTSSTSSNPSIAYGSAVSACSVGLAYLNNNLLDISNSPNPLKTSSIFSLNLPTKGSVKLEIFNILGKKVRTLMSEKEFNGHMDLVWKGDADNGTLLSIGYYFYSLRVDDKAIKTNKIVISR